MKETERVEVTILIPAFNEEQSIGNTISKLKEMYPCFEILVIDDGSTDDTMQIAMDAGASVWPHPYNIGNGAAIKSGLRLAKGEWIIMMDADGQHNPEDIAHLLEHKDSYDMVIGARIKGSVTDFHRDLANKLYNKIASYVTRFKIMDLTSGFRLVRRSTVQDFIYLLPNTFSYPTTLTMAYLRMGRSLKYVPIISRRRTGRSKIRLVEDGIRFLLIIFKVATLFSPLRMFLPVSALLFCTGLSYYAITYFTEGRFTNMSALFFTTSVITFMIGLVSEQIAQMRYDRVK
ncbi:glycosyltransferase family 2 protein [Desulfopila aestuarii]|uniref:Glycosyltransferase involved in cell wall bisynthesis n=1 Tax=Desulfopila aestuarii DSM 18488 TaxID=1121416 RepID=A0A1M7Y1R2_9BACT|nr:glycosyltransferase family 2 protein [Desulfopila aestuarii]SHO45776.1 Glycosyltransferase involved in cell wall bisynthesis [Desulfopila aestuarii DSM 18488]